MLATHDIALGAFAAVKALGRDRDTVWIVTGDIGIDAAAKVPFLEEVAGRGTLRVPLVVRSPNARARTQRRAHERHRHRADDPRGARA